MKAWTSRKFEGAVLNYIAITWWVYYTGLHQADILLKHILTGNSSSLHRNVHVLLQIPVLRHSMPYVFP